MKIFITVGTTRFDTLIEYMDSNPRFGGLDMEFQIANGRYVPRNHPYVSFVDGGGIDKKYMEADVVITHAGQGTIFKLLRMGKRFIVVPNLERIDNHQLDIAGYVSKNRYALVARDFGEIEGLLDVVLGYDFVRFEADDFFKADEIIEYIF